MTPEFLRASISGDIHEAERLLRWSLPDGWPDILPILEMRLGQLEADPSMQPWLLRAIGLRNSGQMVGHIGFHTTPGAPYLKEWSANGVEFGVSIFPEFRREGYARESALGLMRWALDVHGVCEFVVTVGRTNEASRVLFSNMGFSRVGEHVDEVDGVEDIYIWNIAAAA